MKKPLNIKSPKSIITLLVLGSTALSGLSGCAKLGSNNGGTEQPISTIDVSASANTVTYGIGDIITTSSGEFCVRQVYSFRIDEQSAADLEEKYNCTVETGQFIAVDISYKNLLTEDVDVSASKFEAYLDNDQVFAPEDYKEYFMAFIRKGQLFEERTLHPGRSERGYIVYSYFRNASEFEVVCDGVSVKLNTAKINIIPLPSPTPVPVPSEVLKKPITKPTANETTEETTAVPTKTPTKKPVKKKKKKK